MAIIQFIRVGDSVEVKGPYSFTNLILWVVHIVKFFPDTHGDCPLEQRFNPPFFLIDQLFCFVYYLSLYSD